jgi:RimJ/RimL family protein N-acetyltransferase
MAGDVLSTERLTGRPWRADDWPFLLRLQSDPRSGPWITRRGATPTEDLARASVARFVGHWAAHGFGPRLWFFEGRPAALAGLRHQLIDGRAVVEALWTVEPDLHGRGLAPEAMRAALAADAPEARAVEAWTRPDNAPSQRVMAKLGFVAVGACVWADMPHLLFRLNRR